MSSYDVQTYGIGAPDMSPIVVDIETAPLVDAEAYLEPVTAARNLKDPEKIKADIDSRTAERAEKLGLDWNVGRIVAIGWWTEVTGVVTRVCPDEDMEAIALMDIWAAAKQRTVIGFYFKNFDGPYLIQRSRYLGVTPLQFDLGRYSRKGVIDLFNELTFNDSPAQTCMKRSLKAFAKRFGIAVPDEVNGADVPALVRDGKWDQVQAHVEADVALTVALARRLGYLKPVPQVAAVL